MSDPTNFDPQQAIRQIVGQVRLQVAELDRADRARLVEDLVRSTYEFSKTLAAEGEEPGAERRGLAQLVDAATHHTYELAAILGVQVPLAQPRRDLATELAGLCSTLTAPQRARLVEDVVRAAYDHVKLHDPEGEGLDGRNGPERRGLGQLVDEACAHRIAMIKSARPDLSSGDGAEGPGNAEATDLMSEIELSLRDPTEAHQQAVRRSLPGDDNLVDLTVLQAQKCMAVVSAYLDDHAGDDDSLWADPVRKVIQLLSVRATTAQGITHTSTDPWPELDALPWPPPNGHRRRR